MSLHRHDAGELAAPAAPTFRQALRFWLKLGFISFGGPAGQIAIMHAELVEQRRWISERRFLHALNYCMILPGPEAQQLATYIGWLLHRTWGGVAAGVLFVLPSLFILVLLSWIYLAFGDLPPIAALFSGIKPAVTAIVLHAAWRIGSRSLRNALLWTIAALAFLAIFALRLPFPLIVLVAAIAGWVGSRLAPQYFRGGGVHGGARKSYRPAVIDDSTPTPPHAHFSWPHLLKTCLACLLLWLLPFAALLQFFGWQHGFTQMAWFFTKAAWLTFGGAYAVLPYVYQGAVETYGWLSAPQMIDGLALGESTPGPLIMVVAFVAFLGGYQHELLGAGELFLGGMLAAGLVTWFTFLPSFLLILAGGPLVESTHDDLKFTAPLTAVTAAIVGVILNLALFFAGHVWWPQGRAGGVEWQAVLLTLLAALALFHFKAGVMPVIGACAAAGVLFSFVS